MKIICTKKKYVGITFTKRECEILNLQITFVAMIALRARLEYLLRLSLVQ